MQAITINDQDEAKWSTVQRPTPARKEVLIKVHAAGVNRADLVQRSGNYPPPPGASSILGLEIAGEVVSCGEDVDEEKQPLARPGSKVCALLAGGGYAEYVTVHEDLLLPVPEGYSLIEAAALPEVYFTAWLNLFMLAEVERGELAVIHAGASGVGTAAIQLCKEFGVHTIATASASKLERLTELGADHVLDRRAEDMFAQIKEIASSYSGVDAILDPVGADYLEGDVDVLGLEGRLVLIGLMSGRAAELNLGKVLVKRLKLMGSTLRSRPVEEKARIADELRKHVWPLFFQGKLTHIIDSTFPITATDEAHKKLASNTTTGKIILTFDV